MELDTKLQEQTIMYKKFDDALSFQMILFSIEVGGIWR
jgi:hypothetical protein